jgi:hypothetical protein
MPLSVEFKPFGLIKIMSRKEGVGWRVTSHESRVASYKFLTDQYV